MTSTRKFKSETFAAIHDAATDLFEVGAIAKTTMREFDAACIATPTPLAPADITRIRQHLHISQPVVRALPEHHRKYRGQMESGAKRPSGMALKLLHVARKNGLAALV